MAVVPAVAQPLRLVKQVIELLINGMISLMQMRPLINLGVLLWIKLTQRALNVYIEMLVYFVMLGHFLVKEINGLSAIHRKK